MSEAMHQRHGFLQPRTRDDRGRKTPVTGRSKDSASDDPSGPRRDRMMSTREVVVSAAVVFLCILGGYTLTRLKSGGLGRAYDVPDWAFWAIGLVVLAVYLWAVWPTRAGRTLARDRVARGCCGSCRYWLQGLKAEADGCTTCPECGSAWRMPAEPSGTARG